MNVPVPPAATVRDVTDEVTLGPATAGTIETLYVIVVPDTSESVMLALLTIAEETNSPKLKLGCPAPTEPVAGIALTVALNVEAAPRSILPPPLTIGLRSDEPLVKDLTGLWAVLTKADFTCSGDQVGWSWRSRAADPATWGVAMLVPEKKAKQGGLLQKALGMEE